MTQKELKSMYTDELRKVWNSEKMIRFCSKKVAYIIEHKGFLYEIDKPRIETRFCFGYGQNGISSEEDEDKANAMTRMAQESKEYFITENMKKINYWIKTLNKMLEEIEHNWAEGSYPKYMLHIDEMYIGQTNDCKLRGYSVVNSFDYNGELCNDKEFIKKLIVGYEEVKKGFEKRLCTYLKRYGLSKVVTWSYLLD